MPCCFYFVLPQLKNFTLTISRKPLGIFFVNSNAMSDPDLDKVRFLTFFWEPLQEVGVKQQWRNTGGERGLNQNQQESTRKAQYSNSHKMIFFVYIFHCKKKGRRWGQKKLIWKKCLSKLLPGLFEQTIGAAPCSYSYPINSSPLTAPVQTVGCYSLHTCPAGGWPEISIV